MTTAFKHNRPRPPPPQHLVEVLVFSTVDIRRAKASATRPLVPPESSLEVVSWNSSGSTPETGNLR